MEEQKSEMVVTATQLIDMKLDDFKYFVEGGHMPVGEASNLKFFFSSQYQQITLQKDAIVEQAKKTVVTPDVKKHLENIYLLLLDIEQKVQFLAEYVKDKM